MTAKITLSVGEEEAAHFDRLSKMLSLKKTELFRRAIALYEDYAFVNELDGRSKSVKEGLAKPLDFAEFEKIANAD